VLVSSLYGRIFQFIEEVGNRSKLTFQDFLL